jgi:hypothetical protein
VLEMAGSYEGWRKTAEDIVGKGPAFDRVFGETAAEFYRVR